MESIQPDSVSARGRPGVTRTRQARRSQRACAPHIAAVLSPSPSLPSFSLSLARALRNCKCKCSKYNTNVDNQNPPDTYLQSALRLHQQLPRGGAFGCCPHYYRHRLYRRLSCGHPTVPTAHLSTAVRYGPAPPKLAAAVTKIGKKGNVRGQRRKGIC